MTTISGIPRMTWHGKPFAVIMWTSPTTTRRFFTFKEWEATLCEAAYTQKKPITIQAEETDYGWHIRHVCLDRQPDPATVTRKAEVPA